MSYVIGTIRQFRTRQFRVIVDALEEDSPVDVDDNGETADAVARGQYVHFVVRVRVIHDAAGELGTEYLGGCIYASIEDFQDHRQCGAQNRELAARGDSARCGSYFSGMIREAIAEARATLVKLQTVRVRSPG